MRDVSPKVYLLGYPIIHHGTSALPGLAKYLDDIGARNWATDAPSDAEKLVEVYGRACYRSFEPGLNPNVTKIRDGNKLYIDNIIHSAHGSVLEHVQPNFMFHDVSRVLTHELVRHRVGVAISQESLRYVRLTDLRFWIPDEIKENEEASRLFVSIVETLEEGQRSLAHIFGIDAIKDFAFKKKLTSAFRRVAPIGLATSIGWSANFRTLRHCIEMRTHNSAEREIRIVFNSVGEICRQVWPNIFGDYKVNIVDGLPEWTTESRKI